MKGKGNYINGKWRPGAGEEFISFNPGTDDPVWASQAANEKDVEDAFKTARASFESWSALEIKERIGYLKTFQTSLEKHKDKLVELISKETGKPLWEAKTEAGAMIKKIDVSIAAFDDRCKSVEKDFAGAKSIIRFKPHGVTAVFGPFNLPGHLPNGHIVPSLLAGNTVVFKPSELTPAVGELMIACWEEGGLPSGVLNGVQGGKSTGEAIVANGNFDGLFFTGSCSTGRAIHRAMAGHPEKILALEMGGNNPLIVTNVKNLKAAAYLTIQSAYITSGQRCVCARRLIVPKGKAGDDYLKLLIDMIKAITVGIYTDSPEPFMGPLISKESGEKILVWQKRLQEQGGKVLIESKSGKNEALVTPGLIDVTENKIREDVEIFGPLLQVIRVKDLDEAIKEANSTAFGLSAGILSDNKKDYEAFLIRSRAGVVNWNRQITGASSAAPFGGVGLSGNHQPSAYFAADYCSYPVASIEADQVSMPQQLTPGIEIKDV